MKRKHTVTKLFLLLMVAGLLFIYRNTVRKWFTPNDSHQKQTATTTEKDTAPSSTFTLSAHNEVSSTAGSVIVTSTAATTTAPLALSGRKLAGSTSPLLAYSMADYTRAADAHKIILLFFHSDISTTSRDELYEITDAFNQLSTDRFVGFVIHMNDDAVSEAEFKLQQDFNVTTATTKIFLQNKNVVLRTEESWGQEQYLGQFANFVTTL